MTLPKFYRPTLSPSTTALRCPRCFAVPQKCLTRAKREATKKIQTWASHVATDKIPCSSHRERVRAGQFTRSRIWAAKRQGTSLFFGGLFLCVRNTGGERVTKLLTLSETAEATGRSVKALRQLIFRGKFPFTKVGGRIHVEASELEKFLNLSRKTTAEEAAGKEAAA